MEKNKKKKLIKMLVPAVLIAAVSVYCLGGGSEQEDLAGTDPGALREPAAVLEESTEPPDEPDETDGFIYVDVGGAVNDPKVVCIDKGARVFQAVEAAGGKREDADLSSVNLASVCDDGQKIYIPSESEESEPSGGGTGTGSGNPQQEASGLVNINTAGSEELQTLTGIGPGIAQRIIDYRAGGGHFEKVDDLKNVDGIGEKTFEKLKDHICV